MKGKLVGRKREVARASPWRGREARGGEDSWARALHLPACSGTRRPPLRLACPRCVRLPPHSAPPPPLPAPTPTPPPRTARIHHPPSPPGSSLTRAAAVSRDARESIARGLRQGELLDLSVRFPLQYAPNPRANRRRQQHRKIKKKQRSHTSLVSSSLENYNRRPQTNGIRTLTN